jgi:hypothetical protein
VCDRLCTRVASGKINGNFKPNENSHYVGGYLQFTSPDGTREKLWFVVTPAAGAYNVPGGPPSLQITTGIEDPPTARGKARLIEAGFVASQEKAGYKTPSRGAATLRASHETADDQIAVAVEWATGLLATAGFIATS